MTIFVTSDTHFGHKNLVFNFNSSPHKGFFDTLEDFDEAMISAWNSQVTNEDTVYHLGDFAICGVTRQKEVLERLNGNLILVKGNHDSDKVFPDSPNLLDKTFNFGGKKKQVIMCHFPFQVWNNKERGSYHLHGHLHGAELDSFSKGIRRFDVGMCAESLRSGWRFKLHNLEELLNMLESNSSEDFSRF
jgi:calcineurin-like phosphoesterase family protein